MDNVSQSYRAVFCRAKDDPHTVYGLQRFRKALFVDELGWDLTTFGDRESDQFDTDVAIHCALLQGDEIIGGFRAIPTNQSYLVKDVFPQLATLRAYPSRADVWEISRFGVAPCTERLHLARTLYSLMFRFGYSRRASALVALADLTYERFLTRLGIRTRRYGPPQIIGTDRSGRRLRAVAGEIPLQDQAGEKFQTLLSLANKLDVHDETLVRGSERISA
ncbi:Acyl-homoserine-lactone synthase [Methyloligella halotolerans]|uniref:Acyl-homoserine-lactone synthase n=1 Tax=Methyloligella halotolerans TaxID=1177755 RepID=A0A1E2S0K6_9HYPH|nr:acyl-homoserine-lactone synthase [Methyloligella halotolerans]ODA67868.1 Acyl-homoserine-lactone synthase [Methyloligella halotolerans]